MSVLKAEPRGAAARLDADIEAPSFEAPSGKGAADENFPVGSFLLPKSLRPHVAIFYAFARAIDDIADNPKLAPDDKVRRLDAFEEAVMGRREGPGLEKALRMRESLLVTKITTRHCCDLISAFRQDSVKGRTRDWADLIDYCNRSAAPVGRYLLDLHGESTEDYPPSDALCNALQVINHLQDCAEDFVRLDRVYLPDDWMAEAGIGVAALTKSRTEPGLRRVIALCLDRVEDLLEVAHALPVRLKSRHLALESGAICALARTLARKLAHEDPLATRVALSKPAALTVAGRGAFLTLLRRL